MARLVFLGTPDAAVPSLLALLDAGHDVALVVSQPDRRRGRGATLVPSPVKKAAVERGVPVTDQLLDVLGAGADLGVVVAYGRLVPQSVLDDLAMVNVHFSLLPRWRGAAPVERAILAGDAVTGACLMRLEAGLDTGPVLARAEMAIGAEETAPELTARLARLGADLLVSALLGGVASLGPGEPQAGEATYAAKIDSDELRIDWERPAEAVVRLVRLGRAFTTWRGQRLRVLAATVRDAGGAGDVDGAAGVEGAAKADGAAGVDGAVGVDGAADAGGAAGGPVGPGPGSGSGPGTGVPPVGGGAGFGVVAGDGRIVDVLTVQAEGRRPTDAGSWWHGARPAVGERLGVDPAAAPPIAGSAR